MRTWDGIQGTATKAALGVIRQYARFRIIQNGISSAFQQSKPVYYPDKLVRQGIRQRIIPTLK